jgi:amino acid permease
MRRFLLAVALLVTGAFLLILLAAAFVEGAIHLAGILSVQHALGIDTQASKNYDSVSGYLPIVVTALGFSGLVASFIRHVNCEQRGCWRLGHPHPDHGRPVCKVHYHANVRPPRPGRAC